MQDRSEYGAGAPGENAPAHAVHGSDRVAPLGADAGLPADLSDPESGTAPTVASGEGGERDRRHADCRKYEATVQAQAALAGVRVIPVEGADGRRAYLVGRWSLTRPCDTLEDVTAFLQKMGIRT